MLAFYRVLTVNNFLTSLCEALYKPILYVIMWSLKLKKKPLKIVLRLTILVHNLLAKISSFHISVLRKVESKILKDKIRNYNLTLI